jgi:hypothetical protein
MKKLASLAVLLLATAFVFAQPPQERRGNGQRMSPEDMAKRNTEWMTKDLKLTPDQVVSVDSINLIFAQAQQILFQSANEEDREKIRETMTALNREKEKALSDVLTREQLELYKKKIGERLNRRRR